MFGDWRAYKRTVTNRSQANGGWFRGSYFIETDRVNRYDVNHVVRLASPDGRFAVFLAFVY
jgi:hypothetical protein